MSTKPRKKYYYISHLGGNLFSTTHKLSFEEIYCEQCGDYDDYLGAYYSEEEAEEAFKKYKHEMWGCPIDEDDVVYDDEETE